MTISKHSSLEGIYQSSYDGWAFDKDDADLETIDNAIAAWTEWREFVVKGHAEQTLF